MPVRPEPYRTAHRFVTATKNKAEPAAPIGGGPATHNRDWH